MKAAFFRHRILQTARVTRRGRSATAGAADAVETPVKRDRSLRARLTRSRQARLAVAAIGALAAVGILAPVVAPYSPTLQALADRLQPPGFVDAGGGLHLLGTDQFGRDVLSRLIYGVRIPLAVGFSASLLGAVVGLLVGIPAGYFRGRVDGLLSILIDIQLSMPFILVALAIVALFGPSALNIILVFALTGWAVIARVARAAALALRRREFVEAARVAGAGDLWIIRHHIIANTLPPVLVVASVQVAQFIIYESAFGFFGLGIRPPEPTWGNMLADAREYLRDGWWMGTFPGLAIMVVALAANVLGDAIRDALDPREASVVGGAK